MSPENSTPQPFRLVQRTADGRFYAGNGHWTEEPSLARRFPGAMQALEHCDELYALSGQIVFTSLPETGALQLLFR